MTQITEKDQILHSASLDAGDVFRTLYYMLGPSHELTKKALDLYIELRQSLPRDRSGKHMRSHEAYASTC